MSGVGGTGGARRRVARTGLPVAVAAVGGNAVAGRAALAWFAGLRRPRWQVPLPVFAGVGVAYYGAMTIVLDRADQRGDERARRAALAVLAGNELWNVAFFGRRSPAAGFAGMLAFTVPVGVLLAAVREDRVSRALAGAYALWVVGYDVPWSYRLWRLNPPS
ncbi:TspO/MBR family protein [Kineococcus sp. SYSU DK004]|uniref:TspO/MBR family protein n=1 Tax=Kineococcus sp. SYSU DK004 TaxID=3383125 RepID=UPI003D7E2322